MKRRWRFRTKNFEVVWETEPETLDTKYMDPELARECIAKVDSGEWECFTSHMVVRHRRSNTVLGEAWLGNSIYENPDEFRDHIGMNKRGHGSYFSDMVREAIAEARKNKEVLESELKSSIAALKKLSNPTLRSTT